MTNDPKKRTFAQFYGGIFFSLLAFFFGFGWYLTDGSKFVITVLVILTLADFADLLYTYFQLKKLIVWFRQVTITAGIFCFYTAMICLFNLNRVLGSATEAALILLCSISVIFFLSYRFYREVWSETLPVNIASGKIDLDNGVYSVIAAPAIYKFKTGFMRKASGILIGATSYLVGVAVIVGINAGKTHADVDNLRATIIFGLGAIVFSVVVAMFYYQYKWVKDWQNQSGRIMVTKYV